MTWEFLHKKYMIKSSKSLHNNLSLVNNLKK
jgi:hypothetical protein